MNINKANPHQSISINPFLSPVVVDKVLGKNDKPWYGERAIALFEQYVYQKRYTSTADVKQRLLEIYGVLSPLSARAIREASNTDNLLFVNRVIDLITRGSGFVIYNPLENEDINITALNQLVDSYS